jgi:hypothetical protein
MLRPSLLVAALFAASTGALAQNGNPSGVDFLLRPSQDFDVETEDDPWAWTREEPEPDPLTAPVGPPLAGPSDDNPIGPPLAGPPPRDLPALVARARRRAEEDPFAAVGMRLGSFVIRPAIEIGVVATDNAGGTEDEKAAFGVVVAPDISIRSEDERHQLSADIRGEGVFYDREEFNSITGEARLATRYELTSRTSLAATAGYARFEEGFSDPDTPGGAIERPVVHGFDASLAAEHRFGRLAVAPSLFFERSVHEDVALSGGGVASREELDDTEYGVRVRTGYRMASLTPFTEVAVGRRDMDQDVDDSGFERSSVWGELRGGVVIDRGEKLSGELSLGYRREDIEDDRLQDIDAFVANAALLWSPRRLTEIRFDLSSETQPTSVPDVSATILYAGTATAARRLTPRVRVEAGAGLEYETPIGDEDWEDLTFRGFAGASYAFSRRASLVARYEYEKTESTLSGGDSRAHTVTLRVRLQR